MSIQLNHKSVGCSLSKATKRLNGRMMRDFKLYVEVLSSENLEIESGHTCNIVVKDASGKVTYMGDSSWIGKEYKLYAGYPMFLKYEYALDTDEWKALLQGLTIMLTIKDDMFNISQTIYQLRMQEGM